MLEDFKSYVLEYDFRFRVDSIVSGSLIMWDSRASIHITKEKLVNGDCRYFLTYKIFLEKTYQFTLNSNFEVDSKQKSKYLKLENEILSVFEKHLLLGRY